MALATRIKMKPSYSNSSVHYSLEDHLLEIDEIYLTAAKLSGWYKKNIVHEYVDSGNEVFVNISPNPKLIAALSKNNEKYVRSTPNNSTHDNLLNLPRG